MNFSQVYDAVNERIVVYKIVYQQYPVPELAKILKQWEVVSDASKTNNQVDRALKKIGKLTIELNTLLGRDIYLVNAFNNAFEQIANSEQ